MIERQVMSAMDVWEWMTDTVHDPSMHPEITNKLSELFDDLGRDNMQQVAIDIGTVLSGFYMECAHYDYEQWGGPYEGFIEAMMKTMYLWLGDFVMPTPDDCAAMYTYVSTINKHDMLFNEFLSLGFEWHSCGEFLAKSTGDKFIEPWEPEEGVWMNLKLLDHMHTVYGRGSDGFSDALVDFPPGPYAAKAYKALHERQQEILKHVA